jgi:DNA-binding protein H-NS
MTVSTSRNSLENIGTLSVALFPWLSGIPLILKPSAKRNSKSTPIRLDSAKYCAKGKVITMAKKAKKTRSAGKVKQSRTAGRTNLAGMDFESLMELRKQVESALSGYRSTLEQQLASIGGSIASFATGRGRRSTKGRKVAAKYRGPEGELWAGRGATPRWLVAAMKDTGKKREDFLIDKGAGRIKTKRRAKKK